MHSVDVYQNRDWVIFLFQRWFQLTQTCHFSPVSFPHTVIAYFYSLYYMFILLLIFIETAYDYIFCQCRVL